MAGHVARMKDGWSAFKILTGTPTGKRHLGRPRRIWEDNIRMDLKETGINTRNWIDTAQDRNYWRDLVNAALNFRVSKVVVLEASDRSPCYSCEYPRQTTVSSRQLHRFTRDSNWERWPQ